MYMNYLKKSKFSYLLINSFLQFQKTKSISKSKFYQNLNENSLFDSKIKEIEESVSTIGSNSSKNSLNSPHYLAQKTKSLEISKNLFFVNSLVKKQKGTIDYDKFKNVKIKVKKNSKKLTLEDYEKFNEITIEKHLNTKMKHKGCLLYTSPSPRDS